MIAESRRKVWEKIIKETVREASVVYNGRCPLTRFWREIASALYIPQMSKRLSDYQRPSLPNSNCPPTPLLPLSFSSLSMLFCMVTFGFMKIKRGGERVIEDCHGRCPGEVSQPIISGNVGLWKKLWQFETALATIVMHFCSCVCVPTSVYSFVRLTQH